MKKLILFFITLFLLTACNSKTEQEKNKQVIGQNKPISDTVNSKEKTSAVEQGKNISEFVPKGYIVYKEEGLGEIKGDLNKDGLEDIVLFIKGTNKNNIIQDQDRGKLDRNRRGIIILFNKGTYYELAAENDDCFSSENEDGGVYYAPELSVSVEKGNLSVNYAHGRYGYWGYTFRHQNGDFELIGYDASSTRGPVPQYETSINFLTKKKLTRDNLNKDDDGDNYVENFKDTWEKIDIKDLVKLSAIKDFDALEF